MIGRFLGRFPRTITGLILAALVASLWQATVYIETVIRPREAAAREARILGEIDRADSLFTREKYALALSEYQYAIASFAAELGPLVVGRLHDREGQCLAALAAAGEASATLQAAKEAYDQALAARTLAADPAGYVETLYHMGDAHLAASERDGDAGEAETAIETFERALAAIAPDGDVAVHTKGLRSLGNAYRRVYAIGRDAAVFDQALARYDEALRLANPLEQPIEHGATLLDLGRAYVLLSEGRYRLRHLEKALETFEKALDVFTVEAFPRDHAATHALIADTYIMMSQTKPKSQSDRAAHQQRVIHWSNKAKQSSRIAKSFGFVPQFAVAGADDAPAPTAEDEDKAK